MNAEHAYEQHTALARALSRPDSPERAHLADHINDLGGTNPLTGEKPENEQDASKVSEGQGERP